MVNLEAVFVKTNGSEKIEALRKREAALKAAIAAEQVRQQKQKAKELKRDFADIGETLAGMHGRLPPFT